MSANLWKFHLNTLNQHAVQNKHISAFDIKACKKEKMSVSDTSNLCFWLTAFHLRPGKALNEK